MTRKTRILANIGGGLMAFGFVVTLLVVAYGIDWVAWPALGTVAPGLVLLLVADRRARREKQKHNEITARVARHVMRGRNYREDPRSSYGVTIAREEHRKATEGKKEEKGLPWTKRKGE